MYIRKKSTIEFIDFKTPLNAHVLGYALMFLESLLVLCVWYDKKPGK